MAGTRQRIHSAVAVAGLGPATITAPAQAARMPENARGSLSERLSGIRTRVMSLESELLDSMQRQRAARTNIKKIQQLMKLQQEERVIGRKRLEELEKTIGELEARRGSLRERILVQQR